QQFIEKTIEKELENIKLEKMAGISKDVLKSVETRLSINTITLTKEGEKSANMGVATLVGIICGLIIYMFVFLYSVQVMRGVMEEKMNRIVEIIISSVRPFELMMGKIIGIAGVGLTQIFIWFVLGTIIISGLTFFFGVDTATIQQASELSREMDTSSTNAPVIHTVDDALYALSMLNVKLLVISFVFYFLFGYLIYAALFGAIGAAVDTESDTQQFMLPITIPLVLAISLSSSIISEPNGQLAFWLSMIPLTSPVAMMIRLPFLELGWEVFLSMFLLVVSFLGVTWMAAKIYRVGILMYGKKTTYKELAKWLFY
ncbi:MAG: ABC transporter permease, partial [Flammeovirgaceae bacterium]|nr:ABC transporter permease [Flammeovirgaceae bacterium]MDW8288154.1 ABC transporter permease [Flammeovirgaceae bacterium]